MKEYDDIKINGNIPSWMKYAMVFIDRVGFPVLAFILMFIMSFQSLSKVTEALNENSKSLIKLSIAEENFHNGVKAVHDDMDMTLNKIYEKTYGYLRGVESPKEKEQ